MNGKELQKNTVKDELNDDRYLKKKVTHSHESWE